tara:strand:- start:4828 stop:5001 length:174 start_codon:yes stop_codon:yes gene_type:complete
MWRACHPVDESDASLIDPSQRSHGPDREQRAINRAPMATDPCDGVVVAIDFQAKHFA